MPKTTDTESKHDLRVLVVDNEAKSRQETVLLLEHWKYVPFVAEGSGEQLEEDAVAKARQHRCHIALVDMRLRDDKDTSDWSGLKLVPRLQPTKSIIVSAFGDRKNARAALLKYKAVDIVGKEDAPEALQGAIVEIARIVCVGNRNIDITWSPDLTSASIIRQLFPKDDHVPPDEADELLCQMFPHAQRIALELITSTTPLSANSSALRRRSRVFMGTIDNDPASLAIKFARTEKIAQEINNYSRYVERKFQTQFRPAMEEHAQLWDLGGVAYTYFGHQSTDSFGVPETFATYYRKTSKPSDICKPLDHFFGLDNWGYWYATDVNSLATSLFDAYDTTWHQALSNELDIWRTLDQTRRFAGLQEWLPDPMRWLSQHHQNSNAVRSRRQAVTHGDLHGDNLFVDNDGHAWPIDFERTGPGPILRDFVELVQDILTRLASIKSDELTVLYELVVALCEPHQPHHAMHATRTILDHAEAKKAFDVVQTIQKLAAKRASYTDRREYLWGLLLNSLFVATLLPIEDPRREKTLLVASVICGRLDRGAQTDWPPANWPRVEWIKSRTRVSIGGTNQPNGGNQEQQPQGPPSTEIKTTSIAEGAAAQASFSQGHALLIGVGNYQHIGLTVPTTANDARRLEEVLHDPLIAAYPSKQLRVLSDQEATCTGIIAALDSMCDTLPEPTTPSNGPTVLLFFAGHGKRHGDDYLLLPYDYDPNDLARTTIDAKTLRQKVDAIARRAKKVLILLNCCYAGGIGDGTLDDSLVLEPPPQNYYAELQAGGGRVIISAAKPDERAGARSKTDQTLTVFGAHLIAALQGGASGSARHVTVFELFAYLTLHVPVDRQEQHPLIYARGVDSDFAVALRPPAVAGTLTAAAYTTVRRLVEVELKLAPLSSEAEAPHLVKERDELLAQLGH